MRTFFDRSQNRNLRLKYDLISPKKLRRLCKQYTIGVYFMWKTFLKRVNTIFEKSLKTAVT